MHVKHAYVLDKAYVLKAEVNYKIVQKAFQQSVKLPNSASVKMNVTVQLRRFIHLFSVMK